MALRNYDFSSYSKRLLANCETETSIPGRKNGLNFIVIPHWIADKIELMGGNPGRLLFHGNRIMNVVQPNVRGIDICSSGKPNHIENEPSGVLRKLEYSSDFIKEYCRINTQDTEEKITRESLMLSAEDWSDIALLNFVLGFAFNRVKSDIGLPTSVRGGMSREYSGSSRSIDDRGKIRFATWRFGNVDTMLSFHDKKEIEKPRVIDYDGDFWNFSTELFSGRTVADGNSLFYNKPNVRVRDIIDYAADRFISCAENIPERIGRTADTINVYDNQSTITFVLKPDTVKTLVRYLTVNDFSGDGSALRDELVRIMEVVIDSNKKWFSIRKLAKSGLILHLSSLL